MIYSYLKIQAFNWLLQVIGIQISIQNILLKIQFSRCLQNFLEVTTNQVRKNYGSKKIKGSLTLYSLLPLWGKDGKGTY